MKTTNNMPKDTETKSPAPTTRHARNVTWVRDQVVEIYKGMEDRMGLETVAQQEMIKAGLGAALQKEKQLQPGGVANIPIDDGCCFGYGVGISKVHESHEYPSWNISTPWGGESGEGDYARSVVFFDGRTTDGETVILIENLGTCPISIAVTIALSKGACPIDAGSPCGSSSSSS